MNKLKIFESKEFGKIRTVNFDGEPMFCLADICKSLDIRNTTDVSKRLDDDELTRLNLGGRSGETWFVNESGLYSVILRSDKPNAKNFRRWVTGTVLPSIRKNGGYIANQEKMNEVELMAKALQVANKVIERRDYAIKLLEEQIEEEKPKVEFFDTVADSKSALPMNEVSKALGIKGYGRNNLFEYLRENKVLQRNNVPYQRYVDNGWFRVVEQSYQKNGEPVVTAKTLVYQKGVDGIRKMLLKEGAENE